MKNTNHMRTLNLFYLLLLILLTSSCAEMNAAMSNATVNDCSYKGSMVSVYEKETGKYRKDYMHTTYNGKDVSYKENSWITNRVNHYLDYPNFGVWYETSRYTKSEYRFSTYCAQYKSSYRGW